MTAKNEELQKLKEYDVCEEVDYDGQDCISTRWILTVKNDKVKARLVARGYEEQALVRRDSPTVAKIGIRILLAIAASNMWKVKSTDIRSAFLQGKEMDRDVYIKPPKEAELQKGKVWKLKKCLYGLNDASRKFYLSIREILLSNGCRQSAGDPSFFYVRESDELIGVIVSHIDDFLHAGNEYFENKVIKPLTDHRERSYVQNDDRRYPVDSRSYEYNGESQRPQHDTYSESEVSPNQSPQTTRNEQPNDTMAFLAKLAEQLQELQKEVKEVKSTCKPQQYQPTIWYPQTAMPTTAKIPPRPAQLPGPMLQTQMVSTPHTLQTTQMPRAIPTNPTGQIHSLTTPATVHQMSSHPPHHQQ